jgi:hypothetical protein
MQRACNAIPRLKSLWDYVINLEVEVLTAKIFRSSKVCLLLRPQLADSLRSVVFWLQLC